MVSPWNNSPYSWKMKPFAGIEDANTIFRGTIRYSGYVQAMIQLQLLGLLDKEDHPSLHVQGPELTWRKFICDLLGFEDSNIFYENLKNRIMERTGTDLSVDVLEELGMLEEIKVAKCGTPLDTLTHYLSKRLPLGKFVLLVYFSKFFIKVVRNIYIPRIKILII